MNLKEIIYNIQNIIAKGRQSQTNPFSDRQVVFILNYYYAKLVEQQLSKNGISDAVYFQDLGPLEVEKVDRSYFESNIECSPLQSFKTECIFRTVKKLPEPIFVDGKPAIEYEGSVDFQQPYFYHSVYKIRNTKHFKYTSNLSKYFILNQHRYIIAPTTPNLKWIREVGVYYDPIKAFEVNNTLIDFNMDYPISGKMLDTIYKLMLETEFNTLIKVAGDTTNNNADESLR